MFVGCPGYWCAPKHQVSQTASQQSSEGLVLGRHLEYQTADHVVVGGNQFSSRQQHQQQQREVGTSVCKLLGSICGFCPQFKGTILLMGQYPKVGDRTDSLHSFAGLPGGCFYTVHANSKSPRYNTEGQFSQSVLSSTASWQRTIIELPSSGLGVTTGHAVHGVSG